VIKSLLSSEWLNCFDSFTKIIVGFSGGLDSTVLLHVLASEPCLKTKIVATHIHHGISVHADSWQMHCKQVCHALGVDFNTKAVQFNRSANIEEGARTARYEVFSSCLTARDCLALGHHQDDQAETVLLQLFRGAGIDGLAAMREKGVLGLGTYARPLLNYSRMQLEDYAHSHQLTWIEDESNQDSYYSRNYLRQQIIPALREKWPNVVSTIARTAAHCQQAKSNLDDLALIDCPQLASPANFLDLKPLQTLHFERLMNVVRVWLKKNQAQSPATAILHQLIDEVIFARTDAAPEINWDQFIIRRFQHALYLDKKDKITLPSNIEWPDFPSPLIIKGTNIQLQAYPTEKGFVPPKNAQLIIRFRKGGESIFLHGQTKKLKKLFQEWHVPPWKRDKIPLLYVNDVLAVIIGYSISDKFFNPHGFGLWKVGSR
jgi:tRNA(Ile)-lysidine synthase